MECQGWLRQYEELVEMRKNVLSLEVDLIERCRSMEVNGIIPPWDDLEDRQKQIAYTLSVTPGLPGKGY